MTTSDLTLTTLTTDQIQDLDLKQARTILLEAKNALYGETMEALIEPQLQETERRVAENLAVPFDSWSKCTFVEVDVKGLSAKEYFGWQYAKMGSVTGGDAAAIEKTTREILFPAHPEHYAVINGAIVETLGGLPAFASILRTDDMPQEILDLVDEDFPMKSIAAITGRDGTIWGYGLSQFRDTEEGSRYSLRVFWPQGSPQIWFDDHARHFSVEYRNFINMATDELGKDDVTVSYRTHLGVADDAKVDEWELMAAKRAILNLKALLTK
jgi:hypothetical protein